jgi:retron-type reverse transcriptase
VDGWVLPYKVPTEKSMRNFDKWINLLHANIDNIKLITATRHGIQAERTDYNRLQTTGRIGFN